MEDILMFTIRKPKYKKCVLTVSELELQINRMKQKYQSSYPDFTIEIFIEPDPKLIEFDGSIKEFNCQARIQFI
jgi:hypothetical protein